MYFSNNILKNSGSLHFEIMQDKKNMKYKAIHDFWGKTLLSLISHKDTTKIVPQFIIAPIVAQKYHPI